MAGGGVASSYDPLDVTQYAVLELRAAAEAVENWGTYVTVHAYTPRAVRQALEAEVRCIGHGQLLDEPTAKLMAEKGVWWSRQPFVDDGLSPFPEGSPNRLKPLEMFGGTDTLERFIARVEQNAHAEAIEEFYTEHSTMQENQATARQGRDAHPASPQQSDSKGEP